MQINSKYDIGQELYVITPDDDNEWFVEDETLIIENLETSGEYGLFYCTRNAYFFTTRQAAQDECDRRNQNLKDMEENQS